MEELGSGELMMLKVKNSKDIEKKREMIMEVDNKIVVLDEKISQMRLQMQTHLEMYHQLKGAIKQAIEFRVIIIEESLSKPSKLKKGRPKGSKNKKKRNCK